MEGKKKKKGELFPTFIKSAVAVVIKKKDMVLLFFSFFFFFFRSSGETHRVCVLCPVEERDDWRGE
jgi:hypothetical protein